MNSSSVFGARRRNGSFVPFSGVFGPLAPFVEATYDAGAALRHSISRKIGAIHRGIVYRRTVSTLSSLDDRTLRDIGIARADITRIAQELCER